MKLIGETPKCYSSDERICSTVFRRRMPPIHPPGLRSSPITILRRSLLYVCARSKGDALIVGLVRG